MRKRNRKVKKESGFVWGGVVIGGVIAFGVGMVMNPCVLAAENPDHFVDVDGTKIDLNASSDMAEASSVKITIGAASGNVTLVPKSSMKNSGIIKRMASVEIGATDGYTIKVSGNSDLVGNNASNKIASAANVTTLGQMSNRWGWYSADGDVSCSESGSFRGMTSAGETVSSGKLSEITTKTVTMCFGAKVDTSQAADNYKGTVTISAVAEPKTATTFGVSTMQAMTPEICAAAKENDAAQLTDTRDGKKYWVTKLKDGNCWMSQNLALDLKTSGNVVTVNDASGNPTQTAAWGSDSYPPRQTIYSMDGGAYGNTETYSWNFGDYVIKNPATGVGCNDRAGLSGCPEQFVDVNGWMASSDPNFYKNNGNSSVNASAKIYDAHYLVGNYYQWNAATAGSGGTIRDQKNADASVCPKNWKLPSSGDNTTNGMFGYLLSQYGVASKVTGSISYTDHEVQATLYTVSYNVALSPLFFVRGGGFSPSNKFFTWLGTYGHLWTSRATIYSDSAYSFNFSDSDVYPNNTPSRFESKPLRCLVQAS